MRTIFSQLTCLYQLERVICCSVMWAFFGSYDLFRFGSVDEAIGVGCFERYAGSTAEYPAIGWEEGIANL